MVVEASSEETTKQDREEPMAEMPVRTKPAEEGKDEKMQGTEEDEQDWPEHLRKKA